jgi:hypothetical protein
VLALICETLQAKAGHLYYALPSGFARCAGQGEVDPGLDRFANGYWQQRQLHASMTTVFSEIEKPQGGSTLGRWTSPRGESYGLVPLSPRGEAECIGLVAIVTQLGALEPAQSALFAALSERLTQLGDVPEAKPG